MSLKEVPLVEDVSYIGATLKDISDIHKRFITAYTNMHSIIHAYFRLLEVEYWKPENADIVVEGQYSIVPVLPGEPTYSYNLRFWKFSFNQVLTQMPITEKEYLDMIKEMQYRIPFILEYWLRNDKIKVPTIRDIINRFEKEILGETFQYVQNRLTTRTDGYYNSYLSNLNRYWELQRKWELSIRMENKYPPIDTGVSLVVVIEFRVMTNDEINELDALKNWKLNNAKNDYISKKEEEENAYTEGVRFADTPGRVPLNLSLYPLKPQPIRPTIIEMEIEAQNRYPPLPDRELTDKEYWNINYANVITNQNNFYTMAGDAITQIENTYGTQDCSQIPDELGLDCYYYIKVRSITTQNLTYLLREVRYPQNPEENLLAIPPRPTQDEIDAYIAEKEAERQAAAEAEAEAILRRQLQDLYREIEAVRGDYRYAVLYWVGLVKAFGANDPETIKARNTKDNLRNQLISLLDSYESQAGFYIKEHLQILIDEFLAKAQDQRAAGSAIGAITLDSEIDILRRLYDLRYKQIDPATNVIYRDDWYLERFGNR